MRSVPLLLDGRVLLRVELADTPEDHVQGLRGRSALAPNAGMLFVWPGFALRTITMRETSIPLDIAFLGSDWRILSIARSVPAYTIPLIEGKGQYVIEAQSGYFSRHRIVPGSVVTIVGPPRQVYP